MKLFDITYISLLNISLTCKFTSRFQDGWGQKPTWNRQSFGGLMLWRQKPNFLKIVAKQDPPKVKICWPYPSLKDQHTHYMQLLPHFNSWFFFIKKSCWIAMYIVVVERSSLNFLNRKFTTTQVLKWGKTSHKKSPLQFIKEKYFCKK